MKNRNFLSVNSVRLAFFGSVFYWIYLALTSRMLIVSDATEYDYFGRMLAQNGWLEFFRSGPNLEPLYPTLIAFSLWLGKTVGLAYQPIQVLIQLLILFFSQLLTLRILRLLKINDLLSSLVIFYLGVSPGIVNSAFSLHSEILTYPLVLAIMLLAYQSRICLDGPRKRIILLAIPTGLLFVVMVLTKGVFELVTPLFLTLFLLAVLFTRNRKLITNTLIYLGVFLLVFYSLVNGYKLVNKVFNGRFTVTERGDWALYGNTARRMEPLTRERFLSALAYVPGENICKSIFGGQKCNFWSPWASSEFGHQKFSELSELGMPAREIQKALIRLSIEKVLQNPLQFTLLTLLEGAKMFFWESTMMGRVVYPAGLTRLFTWMPFKNGLRLGMSFLTLFAFIYLTGLIWRGRKNSLKNEGPLLFLLLCLMFIFSYMASYAIFCINPRYCLPVAPLYLIIIAYVFQRICFCSKKSKGGDLCG